MSSEPCNSALSVDIEHGRVEFVPTKIVLYEFANPEVTTSVNNDILTFNAVQYATEVTAALATSPKKARAIKVQTKCRGFAQAENLFGLRGGLNDGSYKTSWL